MAKKPLQAFSMTCLNLDRSWNAIWMPNLFASCTRHMGKGKCYSKHEIVGKSNSHICQLKFPQWCWWIFTWFHISTELSPFVCFLGFCQHLVEDPEALTRPYVILSFWPFSSHLLFWVLKRCHSVFLFSIHLSLWVVMLSRHLSCHFEVSAILIFWCVQVTCHSVFLFSCDSFVILSSIKCFQDICHVEISAILSFWCLQVTCRAELFCSFTVSQMSEFMMCSSHLRFCVSDVQFICHSE